MTSIRDDISLVEGFIHTLQKTIQQHGDADETDHLRAEAHVDDFIAAMKWVKYLQRRAENLSEQARDEGWKRFIASINGVLRHVVRLAYDKYPEGLILAKMYPRKRGGSVWDPSGGTDPGLFGPFDDDDTLNQDWTWALKAAGELELVTKVLFKHCEEVAGMMYADFMATDMATALEGMLFWKSHKCCVSMATCKTDQPTMAVSKHDIGWRRVIRNFTPSWFSVNMGTGIASILLNTLPYNGAWLYYLSIIVFALNVLLFSLFCILTALRYLLYPKIFTAMIRHPVQSMFLGTFPMGFATIINMFVLVCVPAWGGEWTRRFAWGLWIFDAIVSVVVALTLPALLMMHMQKLDLSSMTAVWLLPIVSPIVAAASGAVVADVLVDIDPQHALWTVVVSYVLWGIGVPMAMMITTIYLQRLTLHKLPPKAVIVSVFLPLGPLGQGGYAIQKLGLLMPTLLSKTHNHSLPASAGDIFSALGFLTALILWGFGLSWLFFALTSIAYTRKFPFNIGWWGFTFPLGVFAMSTCQIGRELGSRFFLVLGTIFSGAVVLLWILVLSRTVMGAVEGKVFHAPCLADLDVPRREDHVA
ncbi:C4-dicarboxylate transporter/malic acid transport protein [Penicillium occitanis (nom. inval.)]|nr:C4-dicarboxylate transporter/malic acid transport protein [Penicillium occitanis (nom. inval.)]PCH01758.1 hypothetical protein PENOC_046520 [Penicillium occitanis (nom. inval.)]